MASLKQLLVGRLAVVRADLDEALDHAADLPGEWAPREGMRTIFGMLLEIAATEVQIRELAQRATPSSFNEIEARLTASSLEEWRAILGTVRGETLALIESLSEDELNAEVQVPSGWWEGLGGSSVPVAELARSIAQHEAYHTGQLVTYLWVSGSDPYDWE